MKEFKAYIEIDNEIDNEYDEFWDTIIANTEEEAIQELKQIWSYEYKIPPYNIIIRNITEI